MKPNRSQAISAVRCLLEYAGEDSERPGLVETPERVIKAFDEDWFTGYQQDPTEVLKTFEEEEDNYSGIVFQGNLPITTFCEHHMAAIFGVAHFGYIPNGRVIGLSKFYRLISVFSRRLQVQERMASQIVNSFMQFSDCSGCALMLELRHMCMESRGIRLTNTVTVTTALRGIFLTDEGTKSEFNDLIRNAKARV